MTNAAHLAVVERAAYNRRDAIEQYHIAILKAKADGHTYRRIADAAGTDPATIHRIVKRLVPTV